MRLWIGDNSVKPREMRRKERAERELKQLKGDISAKEQVWR